VVQVLLEVCADQPLSFLVGITPFALTEDDVRCLDSWLPVNDTETGLTTLPSAEANQRRINLTERSSASEGGCSDASEDAGGAGLPAGPPPPGAFSGSLLFQFPSLAFQKPSSMRPRFLNFVPVLPTPAGGPHSLIFVLWKVPTIVMCRQEQEEKAAPLLWGRDVPRRLVARMRYPDLRKWLKRALGVQAVARHLKDDDLQRLYTMRDLGRADFVGGSSTDSLARASEAYENKIAQLRATIAAIAPVYNKTGPHGVCPISVGRGQVEARLRAFRTPGAFLVWFCMENPGDLCLSVAGLNGAVVHHTIPGSTAGSLQTIVANTLSALYLLDLESGKLYNKAAFFAEPIAVLPDPGRAVPLGKAACMPRCHTPPMVPNKRIRMEHGVPTLPAMPAMSAMPALPAVSHANAVAGLHLPPAELLLPETHQLLPAVPAMPGSMPMVTPQPRLERAYSMEHLMMPQHLPVGLAHHPISGSAPNLTTLEHQHHHPLQAAMATGYSAAAQTGLPGAQGMVSQGVPVPMSMPMAMSVPMQVPLAHYPMVQISMSGPMPAPQPLHLPTPVQNMQSMMQQGHPAAAQPHHTWSAAQHYGQANPWAAPTGLGNEGAMLPSQQAMLFNPLAVASDAPREVVPLSAASFQAPLPQYMPMSMPLNPQKHLLVPNGVLTAANSVPCSAVSDPMTHSLTSNEVENNMDVGHLGFLATVDFPEFDASELLGLPVMEARGAGVGAAMEGQAEGGPSGEFFANIDAFHFIRFPVRKKNSPR